MAELTLPQNSKVQKGKEYPLEDDCENKKDRTKAGYWACRAHKDFGTNVPGRFW